jgi:hypothetical protein
MRSSSFSVEGYGCDMRQCRHHAVVLKFKPTIKKLHGLSGRLSLIAHRIMAPHRRRRFRAAEPIAVRGSSGAHGSLSAGNLFVCGFLRVCPPSQPPFCRSICAPPLRGCAQTGQFGDRRRRPSSQSPDHESWPPCSHGAADRALPADSPPCSRFPLSQVWPCISAPASSWALPRPGWGSGGSHAERVHFGNVSEHHQGRSCRETRPSRFCC